MKFLSNYYSITVNFNGKEYHSIDEVYKAYKKDLKGYNSIEQVLYLSTALKFLQNKDLRGKLLSTDIDRAKLPKNLKERLKNIQRSLNCINSNNIS